jgi:hypothetical protein
MGSFLATAIPSRSVISKVLLPWHSSVEIFSLHFALWQMAASKASSTIDTWLGKRWINMMRASWRVLHVAATRTSLVIGISLPIRSGSDLTTRASDNLAIDDRMNGLI